jgi:hypothetical protein
MPPTTPSAVTRGQAATPGPARVPAATMAALLISLTTTINAAAVTTRLGARVTCAPTKLRHCTCDMCVFFFFSFFLFIVLCIYSAPYSFQMFDPMNSHADILN